MLKFFKTIGQISAQLYKKFRSYNFRLYELRRANGSSRHATYFIAEKLKLCGPGSFRGFSSKKEFFSKKGLFRRRSNICLFPEKNSKRPWATKFQIMYYICTQHYNLPADRIDISCHTSVASRCNWCSRNPRALFPNLQILCDNEVCSQSQVPHHQWWNSSQDWWSYAWYSKCLRLVGLVEHHCFYSL